MFRLARKDWVEPAGARDGEGPGEETALVFVLVPFYRDQPQARELLEDVYEDGRLGEPVAMCLKYGFVGGQVVGHQHFFPSERDVPDERGIGPRALPCYIQGKGAACHELVPLLSYEEAVILGGVSDGL